MAKENKEMDNSKELSSEAIVSNIIMISPIPKVYKKLVNISKDREMNLSTLIEEIVEEYVNNMNDKKEKKKEMEK